LKLHGGVFLIPFLLSGIGFVTATSSDSGEKTLVVDRFDHACSSSIPDGWTEYQFKHSKRATLYRVVPEAAVEGDAATDCSDGCVLRAESDSGGSMIAKKFVVDLNEYPVLRWRWKVEGIIEGEDGRAKETNDFPAGIYVAVRPKEGGFHPIRSLALGMARSVAGVPVPQAAFHFVWANSSEPGETFRSASSLGTALNNIVVVVESGKTNVGKWVEASVNVLEYYNRFFPGGPAMTDGVGIMTDCDNTGSKAIAYYDDLRFCAEKTDRSGNAGG